MSRLHDQLCHSARYLRKRRAFMRRHPGCQLCERQGLTVPSEELDHIIPLAERPDLAEVESNWQALCRSCHENKTFDENNTAVPIGLDGWPVKEVRREKPIQRNPTHRGTGRVSRSGSPFDY